MKSFNNIIKKAAVLSLVGTMFACNDFLDKEPESTISPENYLTEESQLATYANGLYTSILPSHSNWSYGTFGTDLHTDNMASNSLFDNKYVPGQWKTPQKDGSNWYFNNIYNCNYFLNRVVPEMEAHSITGTEDNIKHYVGEVYFLRAYEYFKRYQLFGDFPIIKEPLADNKEVLMAASVRQPRNEVARFILSDLDKAIELMATNMDSRHTRISKEAAYLLKSRVALYEGTWLKYFSGTAFVPNGQGWPGASSNGNYAYPTGSVEAESKYFLQQAMDAAKVVATSFTLTENTGTNQADGDATANPYMDMFGSVDLSSYSEVLLWRQYSKALGVTHCVVVAAQSGNYGVGTTRGLVDGFLMKNGLPIYATGSGYAGDDYIEDVRKDRDPRLTLFLKQPDQKNVLIESNDGDHATPIEPYPKILEGNAENAYTTGYALRKGNNYNQEQCGNGACYTASITFRGVEALLNYIEACYELNGSLDATAGSYWKEIRARAGVDDDYNKTISATDMSKEAPNDWGAYSAGQLVDPTLYNIRRERRCELMAEGLRQMDLYRWRSLDQMINTAYHIEGFKIWGPMQHWYDNENGSSKLVYGQDINNISDPSRSDYYRPLERAAGSLVYNGYRWSMAHYLTPIANQDMLLTSEDNNAEHSVIYQNPGWPISANESPIN